MDSKRLTLLLVSCDGYSDLWDNFIKCKEVFWYDCPYDLVLANNVLPYAQSSSVRVINCGDSAQWSTRTRMALERIDTPYVCFLLEDFFISSKVNTAQIEEAIDLMEKDDIRYYKLHTFSKIRSDEYGSIEYLNKIPASMPYGISLLASIWNREYFLELIGKEDYNPWIFEANRLREEQSTTEPDKILGVYDNRNILNICHMIIQGKYIPSSIRKMRRLGFKIDTQRRATMTLIEMGVYRMKGLFSGVAQHMPWIYKIAKLFGVMSISSKYL